MSYILDALKKSEQERQKHTGPTLQTIQRPLTKRKQSSGLIVLLSMLSIMLGIMLIVSVWRHFDKSVETPMIGESGITAQSGDRVNADAGVSVSSNNSEFETIKPTKYRAGLDAQPPGVVLDFSELPDPVQQEIPALTFSFHVFSDNPEKRTIIINSRRVKEGDSIASGLTLTQITVDGVVLHWQRFYFRINVVEKW